MEEVNYIDNSREGIYRLYYMNDCKLTNDNLNGQLEKEINYTDDKMNEWDL
jgi:antitoxin component YwqK of YwqJK toxin-antitoxin module